MNKIKRQTRRLSDALRRSPIRNGARSVDDVPDAITLKLGENDVIYSGGLWMGTDEAMHQRFADLVEENLCLQEENQSLKFKVDLLINLLAVTKLDLNALQK